MRLLGSVLLLLAVSCGSTRAKVDGALTSITKLSDEAAKTSQSVREDLVPSVKETVKSIGVSVYQIQLLAVAIQALMVNLEPKLDSITESLTSTLAEVRGLMHDFRDLKVTLSNEIIQTGKVRDQVAAQGSTLQFALIVGALLAGVLIILFIVMIHHKLSAPKRHAKQFEHLLQNGGREKLLACLKDHGVHEPGHPQ